MKGTYTIKISNSKVSFSLELERNITIICGKSTTGKTTLIGLIRDYEQLGKASGVTIQCKKPCRVLSNVDWQYRLGAIHDSIVFLDEGSLTALMEKGNKNQLDGTVAAGKKFNGVIGYEVPADWKELEVRFTPDFWSGKEIIFVANK